MEINFFCIVTKSEKKYILELLVQCWMLVLASRANQGGQCKILRPDKHVVTCCPLSLSFGARCGGCPCKAADDVHDLVLECRAGWQSWKSRGFVGRKSDWISHRISHRIQLDILEDILENILEDNYTDNHTDNNGYRYGYDWISSWTSNGY